jgi:hypothetical protein
MYELISANLLSPVVLAFGLGILAALAKSDLRVPEAVTTALAIYLLLGIGLKGGVALGTTPFSTLWPPLAATLALGVVTPCTSYVCLRRLGRFSAVDAAALAAHYGSTSVVTFMAAITYLERQGTAVEGFLPSLVAVLEVPAIVVALLLVHGRRDHRPPLAADGGAPEATHPREGGVSAAVREVLASKSVLLLIGGVVIGFLSGQQGFERVAPFFVTPFQGVLVIFLLEMGILAGKRLADLRQAGVFLAGFGVLAPIAHGALGVLAGHWAGLSTGGATALGTLAASASYIAAPAAVRVALPEANPSYYLTAALAVTFPFNLTLGIPLYAQLAAWISGG